MNSVSPTTKKKKRKKKKDKILLEKRLLLCVHVIRYWYLTFSGTEKIMKRVTKMRGFAIRIMSARRNDSQGNTI